MNSEDRFVSSKVVLGRVSSMVLGSNWRENGIAYLGKAIQKIGYNYSTKTVCTDEDNLLQVLNHKTEIPCTVEEILHLEYNGCRLPINRDNSMLGLDSDDYKWQGWGDYYMIDWPYIKTSFETGELKLFYKEFRFDEEGFILIPDNIDYREYIEWYIIYNLLLDGETLKNKEIGLNYAESKFESSRRSAKSIMKGMSKDRRLAFSKQWNSLNIQYNGRNIS